MIDTDDVALFEHQPSRHWRRVARLRGARLDVARPGDLALALLLLPRLRLRLRLLSDVPVRRGVRNDWMAAEQAAADDLLLSRRIACVAGLTVPRPLDP